MTQLAGLFLVGAIMLSAAVSIWLFRVQVFDVARQQLNKLSLLLTEQSTQEVTSAYLILDSMVAMVQAAEVRDVEQLRVKMSRAEVHRSIRDKIGAVPQVDVASLVDANGDIINFTRTYPAPAINLSQRDYFIKAKAGAGDGVFLSPPVRNKGNNQWTFYLGRRLTGAQGQFIGVALVGFSSTFLSDFYGKIQLGNGASISLSRRDFTLLARWPHVDALMGQVNRGGANYAVIETMKQDAGVLFSSSPRLNGDGRPVPRLSSVRLIDKYQLILNVTITEEQLLRPWWKFVWSTIMVSGCSVVSVLIAFFLLLRALRRREADMADTERLKTRAESANLAKTEFLAMISHEIRTPLTAIIGFSETLAAPPPGAPPGSVASADAGAIILRNSQHLLTVINDILDLSKIEAGRMEIERLGFAPLEVLWGVDSMMGAQARSKGIGFKVEVLYPMPEQVLGDPTRWRQILFNLCSNAVKFTELGQVTLTLSYRRATGTLVCRVADTGIGISEAQLARLFQPFAQADSAIARQYGGTGLGLHLVRQMVARMGGEVSVSSVLGAGSAFEASIAAPPVEGAQWLASAPEQPVARLAGAPASALLRGRILLAEDGPDNRQLVTAFLVRLGLEVLAVENGALALQRGQAEHFDLILMDVQMPVLDGIAATRALRQAGFARPIIALTANVMAGDVATYLEAGCNDCVGKPIDFAALARQLALHLPRQAGPDAARPYAAQPDPVQPEAARSQETALPGYSSIKQRFELALPGRLDQLRHAIASADRAGAAEIAHTLKGSAATFGYPGVTECCRELEQALRYAEASDSDIDTYLRQLLALPEVVACIARHGS